MKLEGNIYSTNYEANGKSFIDQACFSMFFDSDDIKKVGNYKVYLVKDIEFGNRCNRNHYLLFDEEEIREHMLQLQKIIPTLKFDIVSEKVCIEHATRDCYTIVFSVEDDCTLVHKYALTWVRYLYEFPYNIILKEAYKLKFTCHSPFNRQSISNLYMLCSTAFPFCPGIGHSVNSSGYFIPNSVIKKKLHKCNYLNDIYKAVRWHKRDNLQLDLTSEDCKSTEFWNDSIKFQERLPHYLKVMNYLKHKNNV